MRTFNPVPQRENTQVQELSLVFEATAENVAAARQRVAAFASGAGAPPDLVDDCRVAVTEAFTNALLHAYGGRPGRVEIEMHGEPGGAFVLGVLDEGRRRPARRGLASRRCARSRHAARSARARAAEPRYASGSAREDTMTSKREMPGCVVVTPAGEYDLVTREPLDVQIRELQGAGCAVVLDLGDTSFVDAGFVRLLDGAYRRARASGLGFAIVMPAAAGDEVARMLLDLLPLGAEFPIAHTLDRALALAAGSDEPPVAGSLRASTLAARAQAARRVAWRESARTRSLARERDQLVADVRDTVARCRRTAATRAG